jgi:hypothetical protein
MKILTILKKRWPGIAIFLLFGAGIFVFEPMQRQFYLDTAIARIKTAASLISWIIAAILFLLIVVISLKGGAKNIGQTMVNAAILLTCYSFLLSEPVLMTLGMYGNRLRAGNIYQRSYIVEYLNKDTTHKINLFLYDIGKKCIVSDDKLLSPLYTSGHRPGDTIHIQFARGVFGFDYLKAP